MNKKSIRDELGDLGDWEGAVPVRHRWLEHDEPRRHGAGAEREEAPRRRKSRRRQDAEPRGRRSE
ncbi:MAG: hypothetical protein PVF91_08480 [Chromatiales bacterium]